MWLLVLAVALLGSWCSAAEEEDGDISGCCTHLAVTRWVTVIVDVLVVMVTD